MRALSQKSLAEFVESNESVKFALLIKPCGYIGNNVPMDHFLFFWRLNRPDCRLTYMARGLGGGEKVEKDVFEQEIST